MCHPVPQSHRLTRGCSGWCQACHLQLVESHTRDQPRYHQDREGEPEGEIQQVVLADERTQAHDKSDPHIQHKGSIDPITLSADTIHTAVLYASKPTDRLHPRLQISD